MSPTYLFYTGAIAAAAAGIVLLQWESYLREVRRAQRWRRKITKRSLWEYPPLIQIGTAIRKNKKEKMETELYEAVSFLRNAVVLGKGRIQGADGLIEQLAERRGLLSPIFEKMLRLSRQNQQEEAIRFFSENVCVPNASDFSRLLMQWDAIDPVMLLETLLSYQKSIREMRMTVQKRKDELRSDLIYLPVVINVTLIFLNFIYVAYFIDQKQMLTMLL